MAKVWSIQNSEEYSMKRSWTIPFQMSDIDSAEAHPQIHSVHSTLNFVHGSIMSAVRADTHNTIELLQLSINSKTNAANL